MSFSRQSPIFIYCHGLPGSDQEIQSLVPPKCSAPIVLGPLDLKGFDQLQETAPQRPIHLIGFSLGAMTALKIAAERPGAFEKLTLIAPAAPLELGEFLPRMAGRAVFKAAKSGSLVFRAFTAAQRLGVQRAPDTVVSAMFKDSPQPDKDLLRDQTFKHALITGLQLSLGQDRIAYQKAVHTYVKPWAAVLKDITCPVDFHHGTLDNWAPLDMSRRLMEEIDTPTTLTTYEGLGHYSALHKALPGLLSPPESRS